MIFHESLDVHFFLEKILHLTELIDCCKKETKKTTNKKICSDLRPTLTIAGLCERIRAIIRFYSSESIITRQVNYSM